MSQETGMPSNKTGIIADLFEDASRWSGDVLARPMVTLTEVQAAIDRHNLKNPDDAISSKNPANFFKDFIRKTSTANANWPESVMERGYTAKQTTGAGKSFEFIPLPEGQTLAFPEGSYPKVPESTRYAVVQTLSVPVFNKALGREDENWLLSIIVHLHLPQQHLALHPLHDLGLIEVGHMQSNLKQATAEIDGLFYGRMGNGGMLIITMEAKGLTDDILETQIKGQVAAVRSMPSIKDLLKTLGTEPEAAFVLPMAMKLLHPRSLEGLAEVGGSPGSSLVYMADYQPLPYVGHAQDLKLRAETIFDLQPPIRGIGITQPGQRRTSTSSRI